MKKKRHGRLINILTGFSIILIGSLLLWHGFIGAVVGAIVMGFFGQNILLGILAGAGLGILYFLFSEDGADLGGSSGGTGPAIGLLETQAVSGPIQLSQREVGRQILIQRPLPEVFRYVADFENYREWKAGIAEIRRISDQSEGMGARFQQREAAVGTSGQSILEITEWITNRKIAYRCYTDDTKQVAQVASGYYTFTSAKTASKGTIVAHAIQLQSKAGWGWTKQPYKMAIAQDLLQLKHRLEQADK